jgi:serine protease Do
MKKAVYASGIITALVAVGLGYQTHVGAQGQNHLPAPAPFLGLIGPGSSVGMTVRDADSGVRVDDVRADSPASRAGLMQGDVVTEFDGERARSAAQLTRLIRETAPGRSVRISVLRNGTPTTLEITPQARNADDIRFRDLARDIERGLQNVPPNFNFDFDFEPGFSVNSPRRLGVTVTPLGDQLAAYFGVKEGVLVSEVAAGSAADTAGIKAGDVITHVRGQSVSSSDDVVRELRAAEAGAAVEIRVTRNHTQLTVSAKMPERTRTIVRRGSRAI